MVHANARRARLTLARRCLGCCSQRQTRAGAAGIFATQITFLDGSEHARSTGLSLTAIGRSARLFSEGIEAAYACSLGGSFNAA
ncbi:hypothetical protein XAP412_550038 [Xanthomonas phaseoli pv. phaseoli]|uniref:LysR family transcriptional regulator n=1 Tax=Xanthomonas campestris pv. phaseoli TaxID=317013 RepID=A0AB38E4K7_XANCH|nr:hypothetical protein XAP6984_600036 [Xanthomonas phaseoli pv. phaseoli]SON87823.1 hypothetical protein XAP412_550038 [Xanthomonas phaseoli pv. phaseoli]SON91444.1 hypothetical protein XAP7430_560036 [Xanthomonas phaseoli pv. phaseoli]SOO28678.1 hypothetical protein XAP6164_2600036 [Xanthomonas phaseoli pv. phaseoli]